MCYIIMYHYRLKQPFTLVPFCFWSSVCCWVTPQLHTALLLPAGKLHHRQCGSADSLWLGSFIINQGGDTFCIQTHLMHSQTMRDLLKQWWMGEKKTKNIWTSILYMIVFFNKMGLNILSPLCFIHLLYIFSYLFCFCFVRNPCFS